MPASNQCWETVELVSRMNQAKRHVDQSILGVSALFEAGGIGRETTSGDPTVALGSKQSSGQILEKIGKWFPS